MMKQHTLDWAFQIDTQALAGVSGGVQPGAVEQASNAPQKRSTYRNGHFRMSNGLDLIESPYKQGKLVAVGGLPGGSLARDPYTGKFFSVPKR
jgi:hypothetical protein